MDDLDFGQTIKGFVPAQKVYGRYRLERQLGRGGMGVVWLAFDEKLERNVALKFLPGMVMADAVAIDDLKRETRRGLDLSHVNIVKIYDFVDDADSAAIAMEYVDGPTLSTLRIEKPSRTFEVNEIAPWVAATCEALSHAHGHGRIVHRDLKPANLMLSSKGLLKVADFGIARSISDSISRVSVQAASTAGTLVYMSPEQAQGRPPSVLDDVYGLGATIYELLTSKAPFHSGNIPQQVETTVPPSMAERREELEIEDARPIPAAWEQTVAACLEKDPAKRPQSVAEVAERLGLKGDFKAVPPVAKAPARPATNGAPRKGKRGRIAAILALLAALAGAGWWFGVREPAERARQAEIARLEAEAQAARAAQERADKQAEAERLRTEKEKAAAEAARLAAARGGLEIVTDPPGAAVTVGGAAKGASPATFTDLRLGKYPVTVELEGYDPVEKTLEIAENQFANPGLIKLRRSTGTAQIISEPPGQPFELRMVESPAPNEAPVERTGLTPATLEGLPTGAYSVRLSRQGWPDYQGKLAVESGKVRPLKWEFAEGTARIESEPPGAQVYVEGKAVGVTPHAFSGPTGEYAVELRRPGWPAWSGRMTVAKGESEAVRWEFASGSARVVSTPAGAAFELRPKNPALDEARRELAAKRERYAVKGLSAQENAGLKQRIAELETEIASMEKDAKPVTGTTPAELSDLPAGTYTVEVTRPGWPRQVGEVTVTRDKPALASAEFAQGTLAATSEPSGVTVKAGGRTLGKTPLEVQVPNGEQIVRFELAGWPAIERTVTVPKDGTARAEAQFRGGSLRVTSEPSGATVTRNGERLGRTPLTLENQPPGSYKLTLTLDGFRSASTTATIRPGETTSASAEMQKLIFAGTWAGTANARSSDGSTGTRTYTVRVSADERTVWTNWNGSGVSDFESSARRDGDALVWSFRQKPPNPTWSSTCTLRLTGANSASFVRNTTHIAGQYKGSWTKTTGPLTRQ